LDLHAAMLRALALTVVCLAGPALGGGPKQVSLPVGHSTTLALGAPVSKVTVEDKRLVEVRREGRRLTLVGLAKGATEVTVETSDGAQLRLHIYVAADKYGLPY
jgi:Flp pilus assembly secretin CpaC